MARQFFVQHWVVCPQIEVNRVGPDNPYTLRDVHYRYSIPALNEWPVRLESLWVYARFVGGDGTREFTIEVTWLDGPPGRREVCHFGPIAVRFPAGQPVVGRGWNISPVRFPGPGRYSFRLRAAGRRRVLAREYITLERDP